MSKYPKHVWTLEQAIAYMRKIVGHPTLRVERFKIETIAANGDTLSLSWDRKNVGQKCRTNAKL